MLSRILSREHYLFIDRGREVKATRLLVTLSQDNMELLRSKNNLLFSKADFSLSRHSQSEVVNLMTIFFRSRAKNQLLWIQILKYVFTSLLVLIASVGQGRKTHQIALKKTKMNKEDVVLERLERIYRFKF